MNSRLGTALVSSEYQFAHLFKLTLNQYFAVAMTLNLSKLPTEVLINIFSYVLLKCTHVHYSDPIEISVRTKQPDLCALCLTDRRISGIARRFLLEHVWLVPSRKFDATQDPRLNGCGRIGFKDRTSLFLRSCLENPGLQHRIKHLRISATEYPRRNYNCCYVEEASRFATLTTHTQCLISALALSSSLISLTLDWGDILIDNPLPSFLGEPSDCFSALKSLEIRVQEPCRIMTDHLLSWCTPPRLRCLTIDTDISGRRTNAYRGPYKIKSLRVFNRLKSFVHSELFLYVLPEFPLLTTLDIAMPGRAFIPRCPHNFNPYIMNDDTFSPRDIGSCLASTAHSLQHLSMVSADHIILLPHDGSVLDLSGFRQLTKVKLSAYFFGGTSTTSGMFNCLDGDLAKLLPASLQELEIILDGVYGFFYGFRDLESISGQWKHLEGGQEEAEELFNHYWRCQMKSHTFVLEQLRWITDLLAAQPVRLPGLTRLLVSEGTSPRPFEYTDLARQFPLLIEGSNIEVQVLQKIAGDCRASDLLS